MLSDDIASMKELFPKLNLISLDGEVPSFEGELEICDSNNIYWDSFQIRIMSSKNYPYGVPETYEVTEKIERIADRHISHNGLCCLNIHHALQHHASKGLSITDYTKKYVYPFFANQLYFEQEGSFASKEYAHGFAGVAQFYNEQMGITNPIVATNILEAILTQKFPKPDSPCICGSTRSFASCHLTATQYLDSIGRNTLKMDLNYFRMLLSGN